jgi:RTX calcium-binding nonapeptide repeat (4 copies)/Divergent InlB B-repeat domain
MLIRRRESLRLGWIIGSSVFLILLGSPPVQAAPFSLTVTVEGEGFGTVRSSPAGIDCPSDCGESYEQGTSVTLFAYPGGGSKHRGWTGGGCSLGNSCEITISSDTNITATFDPACSYDASSREVAIHAGLTYASNFDDLVAVEVKILTVDAGQIVYEYSPCSDATVMNTDVIRMSGEIPAYILLDFGETGFAPGATPEPDGESEIELHFDVTGSNYMSVMTTNMAENITFGDQGWNLNGDGDIDVFPVGIGTVLLESMGGADQLSGLGGRGTGSPALLRLSLTGGDGPDRVVGNDLQNSLIGGNGPDTVIAKKGRDWVWGTKGSDVLRGGGDKDKLFGGNGADEMNGGQGVDECRGEKGRDIARSCERLADRNV